MGDRSGMRRVNPIRNRLALLVAFGTLMLSGCASTPSSSISLASTSQPAQAGVVAAAVKDAADGGDIAITLGDPITVGGPGATVKGNSVYITASGAYTISGTLDDGQIVVDTADKEAVTLVLNGVDLTSSTSAPIYIKNAKTAAIVLADGTENYVTDGAAYILEDPASEEPDAAIFSKGDLAISGKGSLTVDANYNDAIASKDVLEITAGKITVDSAADGIRGRDALRVNGGEITVTAGGDGLKATNDEDPEMGYVSIEGGTISIDSSDDAIHSSGSLKISGGQMTLAAGDDGIHSDSTLEIAGGDIEITMSYEGIEGTVITINNGNIHLTSSDDGLNVAGGNDGSAINGRPGQDSLSTSANNYLHISGGYTVIDSTGDGIDVNGAIDMTGGVVIVNGPTANNNGALDYDRGFKITGGTLVAAGSSCMAQAPDTSSTQYSVMVNLPSSQAAGTMVRIATQSGEELLTFVPKRAYQSIVLSSPTLKNGEAYVVHTGGGSTGAVTDGLFSGGTYSGGTPANSFTISGVVTRAGTFGAGFPGGRR